MRVVALLVGAALAGCAADAPPAVTAGPVAFSEQEVLGLTPERRLLLGELALFATAVADSTLPQPGRPWIEARLAELSWERLQAQAMLDSAGVGDDMLEVRYRTDPELELTVRHLLVFSARYETEGTRAAARAKAAAALARIRAGEPFPTVAAEVSEEPGAESREGLLTPGREGSWVPEFWAAARALTPGEISPVVETQYGFHVLRLEARDTVPFVEARRRVVREAARLMGYRDVGIGSVPLPDALPAPAAVAGLLRSDGEPDGTEVVRGDEWIVDVGDIRDAAALPTPDERPRGDDDSPAAGAALERAVRTAVALARATAAGLAPDEADRAAVTREWVDRGETWALQLGMAPGASPEAVRRSSLAALAATGQNASLARDALHREWGRLLRRWVPVSIDGETPPRPEA